MKQLHAEVGYVTMDSSNAPNSWNIHFKMVILFSVLMNAFIVAVLYTNTISSY